MITVREKVYNIKDYKLLPEGSPYQLIEGELVMAPAPSLRHQIISANIFEKMREFSKGKGIVLYSPVDVYLGEENACQPDIVFILKQRSEIIKNDGIYGSPDIIIEILSPATAYYDIRKKFRVYERYGVSEYWIVDPEMNSVEVYHNKEGHFSLMCKTEGMGEIESSVLHGLTLSMENIFSFEHLL
ncbi:MAG: Uma2 family endonuclease [Candidatus Brocadia sp.]|nr:Uma2 family endonuclease [Candidatus Brocadia sp.]UJS17582.1 MAG: Uma2 family endonuclease [Candidatus Jettenia sp.]